MKLKLFPKFAILLILLSVLPAAIVGIRTININREGMQAAILELHTQTALSIANEVREYLKNLDREIQYVQRTLYGQMTLEERQGVLQILLDINKDFVAVSIAGREGSEVLKAYNPDLEKNPKLTSLKEDATFISFWTDPKKSAISRVFYVNDDPRINIVYPLSDKYCFFATVSLKPLWDKIASTKIASTGYAFIVNREGRIIAHPDLNIAKQKSPADSLPIVSQVLKAVSVGSSEYTNPVTKKQIVGAYAPVEGLGWSVIIQQDKNEAYVSVYKMRQQAILLVLLSLAVAAVLAFFIARGLTKPLMTLTEAAKLISKRNFGVKVQVNTGDELHELADTFNEMTAELRHYDEMQVDKIVAEKTKTEAVIFSISDCIIMTDQNANIQLLNNKALDLFKLAGAQDLPAKDWIGKPLWYFINNDELKNAFNEALNKPMQGVVTELQLHSKDNVSRYLALTTENVITPNKDAYLGIVTVIRDITLEKEIDKMKDDFLHSITHDLRNPMTSIRGFLKFLQDGIAGPINDQQKKMLATMDSASNRLLSLINDILDIAKLEAGRMVLNVSELDIKPIAQKMLDIGEGLALKKSIKLKMIAPETLPKIQGDANLLERVYSNLIGNALKFTPENGSVTVRLELDGEYIKSAVEDTGEGIPADYIEKIFDKFQQVKGHNKGGTGLGLTISKHIVEAHKGKIWAESKVGEGAKFVFLLHIKLPEDVLMQK